ncbi:hypothetical protein C7N43_19490 [Sphingobacteriales bacterium UPWRP_1]|nr:hypothetical protein B6N25_01985 [Sphingobacteriales bacterium TSM_CSS]PSJ75327.1 hypothetical protein C7N43_19490 [Sphingobacteriales bacterium UPWRP_1]
MSNTQKDNATIEVKLRALYHLQQVDSKIDEIRSLRGELPIEVQDMEDEIEGMNVRIRNVQSEIDELRASIANANNKIEEANNLIARYEAQQMNVKNNREFEAFNQEIITQKLDIDLAKKFISNAKKTLEVKEKTLAETIEKTEARKKDLDVKRDELQKTIAETRKEEEELVHESEKASKTIEQRLLSAYHRIRKSYRNGLAVVTIERASCGGCFGTIPPQRQLEIGQRKKVILCEHCGRILVDSNIEKDLSEITIQTVEYLEKE